MSIPEEGVTPDRMYHSNYQRWSAQEMKYKQSAIPFRKKMMSSMQDLFLDLDQKMGASEELHAILLRHQ